MILYDERVNVKLPTGEDLVVLLQRYEFGALSGDDTRRMFEFIIDKKIIHCLPYRYTITAQALIAKGLLVASDVK